MWELIGMRCLNFSLICQIGCVSVICFHIADPKSSGFKLQCFLCSSFCRLLTWTVFIWGGSSLLPWGLAMLTIHDFWIQLADWLGPARSGWLHSYVWGVSWESGDGWGGWDSLSIDASLQEGHHPWEGSLGLFLRCRCSSGWLWSYKCTEAWKSHRSFIPPSNGQSRPQDQLRFKQLENRLHFLQKKLMVIFDLSQEGVVEDTGQGKSIN